MTTQGRDMIPGAIGTATFDQYDYTDEVEEAGDDYWWYDNGLPDEGDPADFFNEEPDFTEHSNSVDATLEGVDDTQSFKSVDKSAFKTPQYASDSNVMTDPHLPFGSTGIPMSQSPVRPLRGLFSDLNGSGPTPDRSSKAKAYAYVKELYEKLKKYARSLKSLRIPNECGRYG